MSTTSFAFGLDRNAPPTHAANNPTTTTAKLTPTPIAVAVPRSTPALPRRRGRRWTTSSDESASSSSAGGGGSRGTTVAGVTTGRASDTSALTGAWVACQLAAGATTTTGAAACASTTTTSGVEPFPFPGWVNGRRAAATSAGV
ncbi:hypothetical protein [Fimbriiglobus ruber]|uniref:hypothetical protein n=1 Tax=Fimbriiglobus ruber TaxID=1908690 RepID=UPI00187A668E|nr:hypothetical protein [Fimbriiglobus ruber]